VTTWEALTASLEAMLVPIVGTAVICLIAWAVVALRNAPDESALWPIDPAAPDAVCGCGWCRYADEALAVANELTTADLPESFRPGGVA
jgi:hypothetical protein